MLRVVHKYCNKAVVLKIILFDEVATKVKVGNSYAHTHEQMGHRT